MSKTNDGLVEYAKAQVGLPYWYGCFGNRATEQLYNQKKQQFPNQYTANDFSSQIGKRVHDCIGLVKGYLWSDSATSTPKYNSTQDKSAAGMYSISVEKGLISTLPKMAGILVYKAKDAGNAKTIHHVGVFDGDHTVYEAKGHAYGVVVTDMNKDNTWTHWSKCPYISYSGSTAKTNQFSETDRVNFIKKIGPIAQKAYQTLGKVRPSVCVAMACCESAYGSSEKMAMYNAYLGQKVGTGKTATDYWSGKCYSSLTKEEYTVGTTTVIKDDFRAYDSMEQCVFNYYELLNEGSCYKVVQENADYKTQMAQIKQAGYMTSSTEVNTVLKIIAQYNLTQYDTVCKTDNTEYYPKYTGTSTSITEALRACGETDVSLANRKQIAIANGIAGAGTILGNTQMMKLLKAGRLKKV